MAERIVFTAEDTSEEDDDSKETKRSKKASSRRATAPLLGGAASERVAEAEKPKSEGVDKLLADLAIEKQQKKLEKERAAAILAEVARVAPHGAPAEQPVAPEKPAEFAESVEDDETDEEEDETTTKKSAKKAADVKKTARNSKDLSPETAAKTVVLRPERELTPGAELSTGEGIIVLQGEGQAEGDILVSEDEAELAAAQANVMPAEPAETSATETAAEQIDAATAPDDDVGTIAVPATSVSGGRVVPPVVPPAVPLPGAGGGGAAGGGGGRGGRTSGQPFSMPALPPQNYNLAANPAVLSINPNFFTDALDDEHWKGRRIGFRHGLGLGIIAVVVEHYRHKGREKQMNKSFAAERLEATKKTAQLEQEKASLEQTNQRMQREESRRHYQEAVKPAAAAEIPAVAALEQTRQRARQEFLQAKYAAKQSALEPRRNQIRASAAVNSVESGSAIGAAGATVSAEKLAAEKTTDPGKSNHIEQPKTAEQKPETHLERSAWHTVEVDKHGRAVQDPSINYGHEYYAERQKETAAQDDVKVMTGVAAVKASLGTRVDKTKLEQELLQKEQKEQKEAAKTERKEKRQEKYQNVKSGANQAAAKITEKTKSVLVKAPGRTKDIAGKAAKELQRPSNSVSSLIPWVIGVIIIFILIAILT